MKLVAAALLSISVFGCSTAYKAPVKVVKGVTPPVVFPITKATAKVGGNTVKESVLLPIRVVKDSVKTKPKQAAKAAPKKEKKPKT